jgi:hypothetical protein
MVVYLRFVMAGLDPAIHVLASVESKTWMPGTRPGMTENVKSGPSAKTPKADWQGVVDRSKRPGTSNPPRKKATRRIS